MHEPQEDDAEMSRALSAREVAWIIAPLFAGLAVAAFVVIPIDFGLPMLFPQIPEAVSHDIAIVVGVICGLLISRFLNQRVNA